MNKEGYKHLNLLIPMHTHRDLKKINHKTRIPVSEIVRDAIGMYLEHEQKKKSKHGKSANWKRVCKECKTTLIVAYRFWY